MKVGKPPRKVSWSPCTMRSDSVILWSPSPLSFQVELGTPSHQPSLVQPKLQPAYPKNKIKIKTQTHLTHTKPAYPRIEDFIFYFQFLLFGTSKHFCNSASCVVHKNGFLPSFARITKNYFTLVDENHKKCQHGTTDHSPSKLIFLHLKWLAKKDTRLGLSIIFPRKNRWTNAFDVLWWPTHHHCRHGLRQWATVSNY